jgi:hypothetical protein
MRAIKPELLGLRHDEPLAAGVVGAWGFGEGTGSLAADAGADQHHGSITNAGNDGWGSFEVGGGVSLDGVDDYVALPSGLFLNRPAGTVLFLARSQPAGLGVQALVSDRNPSQEPFFEFGMYQTIGLILWIDDGKSEEVVLATPVSFGSWMVASAEWGPGGKRIFLNGSLAAENVSFVGGTASSGGSPALGRRINTRFLETDMALFVFWDRAIGAAAQADMAADPWRIFGQTRGCRFVSSPVGAYVRTLGSVNSS